MASDGATNLSRTFKYLFATQLLSRGIPFIFNSWIIRHLTAKDYALYAVQFHLFVTCDLFLSREGFWRACMRADIKCDGASTGENASKILKVAWMTVPFGVVITVAACILVFWWQELSYSNPYAQAILINVEDAWKSWKLGSCLTDALKLVLLSGTSEAFLHVVATENQIKRSNDSLLVFSLIYLVMNVVLIRSAGAVGLIVANSLTSLGVAVVAIMITYTCTNERGDGIVVLKND